MKYFKIFLTVMLFLLFSNTANAQIYKCKKENGAIQYSDRPCTKGLKLENIRTLKKSQQGVNTSETVAEGESSSKPANSSSSKMIGTWNCVLSSVDMEEEMKIKADGSFITKANVFGTTLGYKGIWKKEDTKLTMHRKKSINNKKEKSMNQKQIKMIKMLTASKLITIHKDALGSDQETKCTKK